jgi:spore germination protein YaaH
MPLTALTVYGTTHVAVVGTAHQLTQNAGGVTNAKTSLIGTSTGWGEVKSAGDTNPWPALGSIGASGTDNGWMLDQTILELQTIPAGSWTPEIRCSVSVGSITADITVRAYKRTSAGVLTQIGSDIQLTGLTITTAANHIFSPASLPTQAFIVGDTLVINEWVHITANSTGDVTATLSWTSSTSGTAGVGTHSVITPGYVPTSSLGASSNQAGLWWWPLVAAGAGTVVPPPAKLTMASFFPTSVNAPTEYAVNAQNVLVPEYYSVQSDGTLLLETVALSGASGYSAANIASIKQYSSQQFVSVVGKWNNSSLNNLGLLVGSSPLTTSFVSTVVSFLQSNALTGIHLSWKIFGTANMSATDYTNFKSFVTTLGNALHTAGFKLMLLCPAIDGATNTGTNHTPQTDFLFVYEDFNSLPVDYFVMRCYDDELDLHVATGAGYPQAPSAWITNCCTWALGKVTDYTKIVAGISAKGYHGTTGGQAITDNQTLAQTTAQPGFSTAVRDNSSQEMMWANAGISYDYSDIATLNAYATTVYNAGVLHVSVKYVGSGVWFSPPPIQARMTFGATLESKNPAAVQQDNLAFMVSMGMTVARLQMWVSKIITTQGGTPDWTEGDRQVNLAKANGLKVCWCIQAFAQYDTQAGDSSIPTPAAMYAFTALLYQRYGTRIDYYQCLNEEFAFNTPSTDNTPTKYSAIFMQCYQALIDNGAPTSIKVGHFGLTGDLIKTTTAITGWFTDWVTQPGYAHGADFGFHYYSDQDPTLQGGNKPPIQDVIAAIRACGDKTTLLNCSEFGYTIYGPSPPFTQQQQANYCQDILLALYADNPGNFAEVYTVVDYNQLKTIMGTVTPTLASTMFTAFIPNH